ncbi:MAG: RHS repeat-associated core domain-containing protein [Bacteroidota bacterium]
MKTISILSRFVCFCLLTVSITWSNTAFSQNNNPAFNLWFGQQLDPSATSPLIVADEQWSNMQPTSSIPWPFTNISSEAKVIFSMDLDAFQPTAYEAEIVLSIDAHDENLNVQTYSRTLNIAYDPAGGTTFPARSVVSFSDVYYLEIDVTHLTVDGVPVAGSNIENYLQLQGGIKTNRIFTFDRSETSYFTSITPGSVAGKGDIDIHWFDIDGAESYELECVYVNDYGGTITPPVPTAALNYDFSKNATRIHVTGTSYKLSVVSDRGYILLRVRGLGRSPDAPEQRQEGAWSIPESGVIASVQNPAGGVDPGIYVSQAHEPGLNWSFSQNFAENGLKKEVVSYADEGFKVRQTVTKNNTDEKAIIIEPIYDAHGRAVIQPLPVPVDDPLLQFYPNQYLNTDATPQPYSWHDFDLDQANCALNTAPINTSTAAGGYYSPDNPDQEGAQAWLPDAQGYPFSQQKFYPDPRGLVRSQAGPGPHHKLGSDHETNYYYADPSQEELNQVFGTEVGYASQYRKMMVEDPNGQKSISVINSSGQTIMTALVGEAPDNLNPLPNTAPPVTKTINLLNRNEFVKEDHAFVSVTEHLVPEETDHTFTYSFDKAIFDDQCLKEDVCFDCVYDLNILIQDSWGVVKFDHTETISPTSQLDTECNDPTDFDLPATVVTLPTGTYTITKTLTANQEAIHFYLAEYMKPENNTCIKTLDDFVSDYMFEIDFSICDLDYCSYDCLIELGDESTWLANNSGQTSADYDYAMMDCKAECNKTSICESLYNRMLADVSPGGQYALFDAGGPTPTAPDPYSLLNITGTNDLHDPAAPYADPGLGSDYHFQNQTFTYLDPDGSISLVNGVAPKNLPLNEFLLNWQPSWAEELVRLHPEYCIYERCLETRDSKQFDYDLMDINTFDEAVAAGYISGGSVNLISTDPYFLNSSSPGWSKKTAMENAINFSLFNINGDDYSIIDLAIGLANCRDATDATSFFACIASVTDKSCTSDLEWIYYRTLYLSKKNQLEQEILETLACYGVEFPGKESLTPTDDELFGGIDITQDPQSMFNNAQAIATAGITSGCEDICDSYEQYWRTQLLGCSLSPAVEDVIIGHFLDICKESCGDTDYPMGASSVPSPSTSPLQYPSFAEVLKGELNLTSDPFDPDLLTNPALSFDPDCNALLITMPPPYGSSVSGNIGGPSPIMDECACESILLVEKEFNDLEAANNLPTGISNPTDYFEYVHGFPLQTFQSNACDCNNAFLEDGTSWTAGAEWGPLAIAFLNNEEVPIHASIACKACTDCETIAGFFDSYASLDQYDNSHDLIAGLINQELGFNLSYFEYEEFLQQCIAESDLAGCDHTVVQADFVSWINEMTTDGTLVSQGTPLDPYSSFHSSSLYTNDLSCQPLYDAEVLFKREFNVLLYDFTRASNQDYLLLGKNSSDKLLVSRLDAQDAILWTKTFDWGSWKYESESLSFQEMQNGDFLITGIMSNGTDTDVALFRIQSDGTLIWSQKYDHSLFPQRMLGAVELSTGQIMVGYADGGVSTDWHYRTILLKIDASGSMVWAKEFADLGDNVYASNVSQPHFQHISLAPQDGIYLGGMSDEKDALALLRLDTDGVPVWPQSLYFPEFPLYCSSNTFSLITTDDDGLAVMVRNMDDPVDFRTSLFKVDLNGAVQWSHNFVSPASSGYLAQGLVLGDNGDILLPGMTGGINVLDQPSILKVSNLGAPSWHQAQAESHTDILAHKIGTDHFAALLSNRTLEIFMPETGENLPACTNFPETVTPSSIVLAPGNYSAVSTTPGITAAVLSPTFGTAGLNYTSSCGEVLRIQFSDNCGVNCEVILSSDAFPSAVFSQIDNFSNLVVLSPTSFTIVGHIGAQQVNITGSSECLGACEWAELALCNQPVWIEGEPEDDCVENLIALAENQAAQAYSEYLDEVSAEFIENYVEKCLDPTILNEVFEVEFEEHIYQRMLYYYDQAGNLIKTIPPEGVTLLPQSEWATVDAYRNANNSTLHWVPSHTLATKYRYTATNQVYEKISPDGGKMSYWHDNLDRVVVSQDAEQIKNDEYSYLVYGPIGRVIESGVIQSTVPMDLVTANDQTALTAWLTGKPKWEQTFTNYDFISDPNVQSQFKDGQQNLRGRVESVAYKDGHDDSKDVSYFYSYDIHGNVEEFITYYPVLEHLGQQYVKLDYDFDLLNGNVYNIHFQEGQVSHFSYTYEYDEDNRLHEVWASRDGCLWDPLAKYFFYQHGPLARTELGGSLAATDIAYTIQGWVAGVNNTTGRADRDIGKNSYDGGGYYTGQNAVHKYFTQNKFGYAIEYFDGDYVPINQIAQANHFKSDPSNLYTMPTDPAKGLYNGNIAALQFALPDENGVVSTNMYKFQYDQLNRINGQDAYTNPNLESTNSWAGLSSNGDLTTRYGFDKNGNITHLLRNASLSDGAQAMDSMTYFYTPGTNQLKYVHDLIGASDHDGDIDDQDPVTNGDNYVYDDIGNLIQDKAEGIASIEWYQSGKIRQINRTPGHPRPDIEFWYGPNGNRLGKLIKNGDTEDKWERTIYVYSLDGKLIATYKQYYLSAIDFVNANLDNYPSLPSGYAFAEILVLSEYSIYGSSRLGIDHENQVLAVKAFNNGGFQADGSFDKIGSVEILPLEPPINEGSPHIIGKRHFEFSDHRNNVMFVISNLKRQAPNANQTDVQYYVQDVVSGVGYYPYGAEVASRSFGTERYRFGFNGKEKDNEAKGAGAQYDYGFRIYDSRLARFLSEDPLTTSYPWYTPYQFAGNGPIVNLDMDGLEPLDFRWIFGAIRAPFQKVINDFQDWDPAEGFWDGMMGGAEGTIQFIKHDAWQSKTWANLGLTIEEFMLSTSVVQVYETPRVDAFAAAMQDIPNWTTYEWAYAAGNLTFSIGSGLVADKGISSIKKLILISKFTPDPIYYRGTTEGYPGGRSVQRTGVTPTSTDPVVSTLYAIESSKHGNPVIYFARKSDIGDVETFGANLAHDLEVGLGMLPDEFALKARSITLDQSKQILSDMGVKLPKAINSYSDLDNFVKDLGGKLSESQLNEFYNKALKLTEKN